MGFWGSLCLFRAIVTHKGKVIPLSRDFTPESERQRVQLIVRMASCTVSVILRDVKVTVCKVTVANYTVSYPCHRLKYL